ncbi:MAG: carbon-nitrogen family hydrolase [Archaeoglobus sp.]|uniref:carbon-nitrogen family hydrolase n=1 Tax=Archaeoglobus sp. TaxID=1872626 RepID=UPI001DDC23B3|nr:carbon-nitrogen family hydrolase [Archaeoglobus sp.]MBO8179905.1 carbon-nitrogen family hydrolase [Archaeoglobus sp.]
MSTSNKIRVALAQQRILPDREVNIMKGMSLIKRALQVKANIVILPEVFNTGFYKHNYESVEPLEEELSLLLKISQQKDIMIITGVAEREGDDLYNSAVIIHRGKIIGKYRKTHLFPLTDEKKHFKVGDKLEVFETPFGKIGLLICYEVRFPELSRKLVKMGAEIIAIPAEFPKERIEHWRVLLQARAIENQVFVAGVNCVEGDLDYGGHSMLVDPMGSILIEASEYQEVMMSDIRLSEVYEVREKFPFLKDLREELL